MHVPTKVIKAINTYPLPKQQVSKCHLDPIRVGMQGTTTL